MTNIDTLQQPVTSSEFRNLLKDVRDSLSFETAFQFSSAFNRTDAYEVTAYSIQNVSLDDEVIESEAEAFREELETLDAETDDPTEDDGGNALFIVEVPDVDDPAFDGFQDSIESLLSSLDVFVAPQYEQRRVKVTATYDDLNPDPGRGRARRNIERAQQTLQENDLDVSDIDQMYGSFSVTVPQEP